MSERAANHALRKTVSRGTTAIRIWVPLAAAVATLLAMNAHLVYVAIISQPPCVAHLRPGEGPPTAGLFAAAQSSCVPPRASVQAAPPDGEMP